MQTIPPAPISGLRESAPLTASLTSRPIVDNSPANILRLVQVFGDSANTRFPERSRARSDAIEALHTIPAELRANYQSVYAAAKDIFNQADEIEMSNEGPILERNLLDNLLIGIYCPDAV